MLTEKLMHLTVAGGSEWVLVLLIGLSVVSVAVMVERALFFRRRRRNLDRLDRALTPLINSDDTRAIKKLLSEEKEPILKAAMAGFAAPGRDREAAEKVVTSAAGRERLRLERRLTFLGTLGNNAPFIGLLGTVLGIIRAFRDLSLDTTGNSSVVMAGISEALVATAVGLFVALPAVMFFNYFMKEADRILSINESLAQGILAGLPASPLAAHPHRGEGGGASKNPVAGQEA